jgi:hypothetical protein
VEYFASSHAFAFSQENMEMESAYALAETEAEKQMSDSLFRYRDSPEEIQGKC